MESGSTSCSSRLIFYWPGTTSNIPDGYQLCDGSAAKSQNLINVVGNNVPNMINRMALAGTTAGGTGGKWQHKLEQDEIPYHRHSIDEEFRP